MTSFQNWYRIVEAKLQYGFKIQNGYNFNGYNYIKFYSIRLIIWNEELELNT